MTEEPTHLTVPDDGSDGDKQGDGGAFGITGIPLRSECHSMPFLFV